jgi:glycosyltransferase involved in cell wall biosynthesis
MDSASNVPRVSIGLPVYNGGELLSEALDSLLAQEFDDFELIISDNASTDQTEEVCREYSKRDRRIIYHRRDRNYRATNNFVHVFGMARGEYFMFAAHDDRWHPRFIAACIKVLEANNALVFATPRVQFLTPEGTPCERYYPVLHTVNMGLRNRIAAIFRETDIGYNFYGLYRRDALKKVTLGHDCYGGDVVILLELMLEGETAHLPEKLFYYRLNYRNAQEQLESLGFTPDNRPIDKPYTSLTINLLRTIVNASLPQSFKRIVISDVLQIISLHNSEWRGVLIRENPGLQAFIEPARYGFNDSALLNITTAFASLLLPYCHEGAPRERAIDFTDISSFDTINPRDGMAPVPGQRHFIEKLVQFTDSSKINEAVAFYNRYREYQPASEHLEKIDSIIGQIRLKKKVR